MSENNEQIDTIRISETALSRGIKWLTVVTLGLSSVGTLSGLVLYSIDSNIKPLAKEISGLAKTIQRNNQIQERHISAINEKASKNTESVHEIEKRILILELKNKEGKSDN